MGLVLQGHGLRLKWFQGNTERSKNSGSLSKLGTYHSELPSRADIGFWLFPAAAEAKVEGAMRGVNSARGWCGRGWPMDRAGGRYGRSGQGEGYDCMMRMCQKLIDRGARRGRWQEWRCSGSGRVPKIARDEVELHGPTLFARG